MAEGFQDVPPDMEERDEEEEEEEESMDSGKDTDSEDEDVSDWSSDHKNPWDTLRQDVQDSLSQRYDKQVDKFLKEGVSEAVADVEAFNALLPVYRRRLRRMYLHYLHWFERLEHDLCIETS